MQLKSLELKNFRQFENGKIEFSTDSENNVTVIHGQNGAGKTTLLNAFTWVLYDNVDFDTGEGKLVNEAKMARANPGDIVDVEVILEFEHEGYDYVATRSAKYRKRDENDLAGSQTDTDISVVLWDEDGVRQRRNNPQNALLQVIPGRLSNLFFFDGEDIDELAGIDNQEEIQEAIQNIMGLTILERSIRHLKDVEQEFEREMSEFGSDELQELISQKQSLENNKETKEHKKRDKNRAANQLEDEIVEIDGKLKQLEETSALQQQRDDYKEELEELEDEVKEINDALRKRVSDSGFLTFVMPAFRETAEDIDELRSKNKIPSELSSKFIDDMLEKEECICGRPLIPGTDHYEKVEGWKSDMSADGVDQAALRMIGHLDQISNQRANFFESVETKIDTRKNKESEISRLEEKIDEISRELEEMDEPLGKDHESPAELEQSRKKKSKQREERQKEAAKLEQQIEDIEEDIEQVEEKISDAREDQKQAMTARRRWKAAQKARKQIEQSFRQLQDKVREWADNLIEDTFNRMAGHKQLEAQITDDFELKIWEDVEGQRSEVSKSTGERQIASLAFIGSLVQIAKERHESDTDVDYFTGGIYPIVMDSPFGALDNEHRRLVGKLIPELGEQIVVLATDSQWEGPVKESMTDIIGRQYWLDFEESGPGSYPRTQIREETSVEVGGQ